MKPTNPSEKQVKDFIDGQIDRILAELRLDKGIFHLVPQGDDTAFSQKEPINLMTIVIGQYNYRFGGISGDFYDSCVDACYRMEKLSRQQWLNSMRK